MPRATIKDYIYPRKRKEIPWLLLYSTIELLTGIVVKKKERVVHSLH